VARLFSDPLGPRVAMGVAALFVIAAGVALLKVDPRRREDTELEPAAMTLPAPAA